MKSKFILSITLLLLSSLYSPLFSQKLHLDKETNLLTVDSVVKVNDSITASTLYNTAKKWIAESFKNPEKVTVSDIKDEEITLRYVKAFKQSGVFFDSYCSLTIKFKNGKYRMALKGISDVKTNTPIEATWVKKDGTLRENSSTKKLAEQYEEELKRNCTELYKKLNTKEDW